jgi:hypothetical protein
VIEHISSADFNKQQIVQARRVGVQTGTFAHDIKCVKKPKISPKYQE